MNARKLRNGISHRASSFFTAVGLAGAFLAGGCSHGSTPSADSLNIPTVAVAPVQRGSLAHTLDVAAEFRPFQEVELHAKEAGYVKTIYVDVGDHVRNGQLLAVLEIPELQDEVNQANAEVSRAQDEITKAQADLRRAQSAHEVAHIAYTRLAGVVKSRPDLVAQQDIDDSAGKDRMTQAEVDTAEAAVASAKQQLQSALAHLQKTKALFAYAEIRAPFDGVITKRYADTGAMLGAGASSDKQPSALVKLSQNGLLRLTIPVPESAVSLIHIGSPATIHVQGLNRDIAGKVTRFADMVTTDTRTMDTEIDVPNPKLQLVPGMYADVSLVLEQQPDALTVPVEGIVREGDTATALVVNGAGVIELRQVKLGLDTANRVQVISGLKENELVVVGGRSQLHPGQKVNARPIDPSVLGSH